LGQGQVHFLPVHRMGPRLSGTSDESTGRNPLTHPKTLAGATRRAFALRAGVPEILDGRSVLP
jgi:hypothetical protein